MIRAVTLSFPFCNDNHSSRINRRAVRMLTPSLTDLAYLPNQLLLIRYRRACEQSYWLQIATLYSDQACAPPSRRCNCYYAKTRCYSVHINQRRVCRKVTVRLMIEHMLSSD